MRTKSIVWTAGFLAVLFAVFAAIPWIFALFFDDRSGLTLTYPFVGLLLLALLLREVARKLPED